MPSLTALIHRFYDEVWNQADETVAREILHEAFGFRGSLGPRKEGPDGFISYMQDVHKSLGDYTCIIDDIIDEGPKAVAKMRFVGIHRAPFFGVEATGKKIEWTGAAFFQSDGQQLTELWVLGDVDAVKAQLGGAAEKPF